MLNLFLTSLLSNFGLTPTKNQRKVIGELTDFVFSKMQKHTFVLKGYAGTGKTSIIGALVKSLPEFNFTPVLLAPTGRAAKVLSNYSNQPAYTIHKMIYQLRSGGDGFTRFSIKEKILFGKKDRKRRAGKNIVSMKRPVMRNQNFPLLKIKHNQIISYLFIFVLFFKNRVSNRTNLLKRSYNQNYSHNYNHNTGNSFDNIRERKSY